MTCIVPYKTVKQKPRINKGHFTFTYSFKTCTRKSEEKISENVSMEQSCAVTEDSQHVSIYTHASNA
jgi:hypothetical protein